MDQISKRNLSGQAFSVADKKWRKNMDTVASVPEDGEKIIEIQLERLRTFRNHPFKVRMDQEMIRLSASVEKYGIINPLIVRPIPDGVYEIISGHRRKAAAEKCIAVGMNAHLAKPLDIEKVEQTICKQLRDAKMTDIE